MTWLLEQVETAPAISLRNRPVLTTFGQHNDRLAFQPRWWELFPHAQQVVIAGDNHSPMNDDPHGVAAAIWSWRQDSSCGQVRGGGRSWRSVFVS